MSSWKQKEVALLSSGITPADLAKEFKIPEWIGTIMHHRMRSWGDQSLEAVKRFLEPSLKYLPDPFSLPDMDQAADRLAEAIVEAQKIAVYGDYDVDGTVGSAVLRRFFRALGMEVVVYQPDRQKDGYGINMAAVENLAEQGIQLMIAVDCGITSVNEVARANEMGMDVIICDHHEPKEILPAAYAVLDHKRLDNESPIRSLSGAGVAFYLAMAVRSVLRDIGHFEEKGIKEPDIRDLLDLVALAAVADLVPLVDENRILLKAGLDKMRKNPSVGIRALLETANVKLEEVSTYHLGFILGPRINASGRLGSANAALDLLTTDDPERARELAMHLDSVNRERMELQGNIADEALEQAAEQIKEFGEDLPAFVLAMDHWHEGVIGIVASRVVERYNRPTIVITFNTHSGLGKGSVRGIPVLDMLGALEANASYLKGFGGHKVAAGLSLDRADLAAFRAGFCDAVKMQVQEFTGSPVSVLPRELNADVFLDNDEELTREAVDFIDRLGPFGMGNSEPVVVLSGWKITGAKTLKERHLKIGFSSAHNRMMEGFWANGHGKLGQLDEMVVDIACLPQINNFRNLARLELKIKDIRAIQN